MFNIITTAQLSALNYRFYRVFRYVLQYIGWWHTVHKLMQKLSRQFTVAMCRNNILFRTKQKKTLSFTYTLDKAMVSITGDLSNLSSHKEVLQFQYSAAHKL